MRRISIALIAAVTFAGGAIAGPNEDALMAVDAAFSEAAQRDGIAAAFGDYAAPDARMFRGEAEPVTGATSIKALMQAQYAQGGSLVWVPSEAVSSADGTLGFTHGRWTYAGPATPGAQGAIIKGSYVSIWQRQPDGAYKFVVDIGNPDQVQPK